MWEWCETVGFVQVDESGMIIAYILVTFQNTCTLHHRVRKLFFTVVGTCFSQTETQKSFKERKRAHSNIDLTNKELEEQHDCISYQGSMAVCSQECNHDV